MFCGTKNSHISRLRTNFIIFLFKSFLLTQTLRIINLSESLMTSKKPTFDYQCHFRYTSRIPSELANISIGEVIDEIVPSDMVWRKTSSGLALLILESPPVLDLIDPNLDITSKPKPLSSGVPGYRYYQLEKGLYHGLQSLAKRYGINVTQGLEFTALENGAGTYLPLKWHHETFQKSLEKVLQEHSATPTPTQ